jgi:N-acetylglucosamine-6-sulfatase
MTTRAQFLRATAAAALLAGGRSGWAGAAERDARPNVLFVLTDDQPPHTARHMPRTLEAFSGGLDLTERAYTAVPLCGPARVSLLTGRYPHNHGALSNPTAYGVYRERAYPEDDLLSRMGRAGYRLGFFGKVINGYGDAGNDGWVHPAVDRAAGDKWVALASGQRPGYEVNVNGAIRAETQNQTAFFAGRCERWVESTPGPFFAYLNLTDPHLPHTAPEGWKIPGAQEYASPGTEEDTPEELADKSAWTQSLPRKEAAFQDARYEGAREELVGVDIWVKRLFAALQRAGVLENTIVIFSSDNGYMFGEHGGMTAKGWPFEENARVPFLVRGPGVAPLPEGALVSHLDIPATILAAAGADTGGLDGRDLRSPGAWRERVLCEHPYRGWSLVREGDLVYADLPGGEREMYDLAADPYQLDNLLYEPKPQAEAKASELSARLDALRGCAGESCRAAEDGTLAEEPPPEATTP